MLRLVLFWSLAAVALLATACDRTAPRPQLHQTDAASQPTNQQVFHVRGIVQELKPDGRTVIIKHEEIAGYMQPMVMPFETKDPAELRGLQPGETIAFRLVVTDTGAWIDQVKKANVTPQDVPSRPTLRLVHDVDPLEVGDPLPEYHFTNQLGRAVSTTDFQGQALAITFIFTRCPFPTMCPLMSRHFAEAQKTLLNMPNAPTNWHLLTISFDTEYDTPAVLKSYAQGFQAEITHWSFLTGELIDVTAIAEQFGMYFWWQDGALNHNLSSVVIDASGRVQRIFPDNKWTSRELVAELLKAADAKPVRTSAR